MKGDELSSDSKPGESSSKELSSKSKNKKFLKSKLLIGYINAAKRTRKIEIGWLNLVICRYRQVRKDKGGGTFNVDVNKEATSEVILGIGRDIFFPNGQSRIGRACRFLFELRDFMEELCPSDVTISEMYGKTARSLLGFM